MNPNTLRSLAFLATFPTAALAWSPGIDDLDAATDLAVDITQRNDVAAFYQCIYNATEAPFAWDGTTGSITSCIPGETTSAYKENVQRRVNYYRAMANVPANIVFTSDQNARAQAAALATSANGVINHSLDQNSDLCYSQNAQQGAQNGNLSIGFMGSSAIDSYIQSDLGDDATLARYRRWILHRPINEMGTGDFPAENENQEANSLYVANTSNQTSGQPSAPIDNFASWPPGIYQGAEGNRPSPSEAITYIPYTLAPERWSIQYGDPSTNIAFVISGVKMYLGADANTPPQATSGSEILVPEANVYGDDFADTTPVHGGPFLSWVPDWNGSSVSGNGTPPLNRIIRVDIRPLINIDDLANISYNVVLIDPDVLTDSLAISGSTEITTSGASYTFPPVSDPSADSYELKVVRIPDSENAESVTTVTSLGTPRASL